jgi:hypothetical protein
VTTHLDTHQRLGALPKREVRDRAAVMMDARHSQVFLACGNPGYLCTDRIAHHVLFAMYWCMEMVCLVLLAYIVLLVMYCAGHYNHDRLVLSRLPT